MASIATGQGEGGKRAVDHEIPLIPFIDLLLCCIMFLLVTAVWNQLSAIQANAPGGTSSTEPIDDVAQVLPLIVRVTAEGYTVGSDAGDQLVIARADERYDVAALSEHLAARRRVAPNEHRVVVTADDGVAYADLVTAMDTLVGAGFEDVSVSGTP